MQQSIVKKIAQTIIGSSLLLGATAYAEAECMDGGSPVPVSGKITNNGQAPDMGFSTLGVVALQLGERPQVLARLKCGIIGVDATGGEGFAFTHTLSCDDNVPVDLSFLGLGIQTAHSQLTLNTHGDFFPEANCAPLHEGVSGSFIEYSSPAANTGRGLFTGVTEGDLTIEGTVNCLGSIDMKFAVGE